jgi:hypothetical protein
VGLEQLPIGAREHKDINVCSLAAEKRRFA